MNDITCMICLDPVISDKDDYTKLKCTHGFHEKCIYSWYKIKKECPYCRHFMILPHHILYKYDNNQRVYKNKFHYYYHHNSEKKSVLACDIDLIYDQLAGVVSIYDIIQCYVKNNMDIVETIMDLSQ
jgi:hypothetical protein